MGDCVDVDPCVALAVSDVVGDPVGKALSVPVELREPVGVSAWVCDAVSVTVVDDDRLLVVTCEELVVSEEVVYWLALVVRDGVAVPEAVTDRVGELVCVDDDAWLLLIVWLAVSAAEPDSVCDKVATWLVVWVAVQVWVWLPVIEPVPVDVRVGVIESDALCVCVAGSDADIVTVDVCVIEPLELKVSVRDAVLVGDVVLLCDTVPDMLGDSVGVVDCVKVIDGVVV